MKTMVTMFAVLVLCGMSFADEEVDREVAVQIEQALAVIGEKAGEAMDAVGERLGEPATVALEHLSVYYARKGILCGVASVLCLFVIAFCILRLLSMVSLAAGYSLGGEDEAATAHIFAAVVCSIILALAVIFCLTCGYTAIDYMSGPERHAIIEAKSLLGL